MKAIVFTKYGPPDVLELEEVETPTPKDDEVFLPLLVQGNILRRGSDVVVHRQVRQKGANLLCPYVSGMTFVMEQDKASDPADIGFLSSETQMLETQHRTYLIDQSGF